MVELFLAIPLFLAFLITLFSIPIWIKRASGVDLAGRDMHKLSGEKVAEAGGVAVIMGFIIGILSYIAIKTF